MADFGPDGQLDPGEVMALGALGGAFADEMLRTEMEAEREIERLRRDPFGEEEAMASEARSWRIIRGADEGPGAASMPDDDDDWDDYDDDDEYDEDDGDLDWDDGDLDWDDGEDDYDDPGNLDDLESDYADDDPDPYNSSNDL